MASGSSLRQALAEVGTAIGSVGSSHGSPVLRLCTGRSPRWRAGCFGSVGWVPLVEVVYGQESEVACRVLRFSRLGSAVEVVYGQESEVACRMLRFSRLGSAGGGCVRAGVRGGV